MKYEIHKPQSLRISRDENLALYHYMSLNRQIDERLSILYRQNKIVGGLYSSLGQEATAVGSAYALGEGDYVAAMIRDIGALLVRGVEPKDVFSQYCARAGGPTRGRDLNLHFGSVERGIIAPISVVGALVPVMAGIALEISMRKKANISMTYLGDGAMSTTDFHEGINFAAVRKLPFVLIIENNGYAYSTPTSRQANVGDLAIRADAYGIYGEVVDGNNVLAMLDATRRARERCLSGGGPVLLEAKTFRRKGHAEHDDAGYVPEKLRKQWEDKDPLESYRQYMVSEKIVGSRDDLTEIDDKIEKQLQEIVREVLESPFPEPDVGLEDVYAR